MRELIQTERIYVEELLTVLLVRMLFYLILFVFAKIMHEKKIRVTPAR